MMTMIWIKSECIVTVFALRLYLSILPPRAAPAAGVFTADCAAAPAAPTNVRPIILWGVSRLKDTADAHLLKTTI